MKEGVDLKLMLRLRLDTDMEIGGKEGLRTASLEHFASFTVPAYSQLRNLSILSRKD